MTRLFKSAAGRGLTSSRYARLGQPPTGDLQKRRYTNGQGIHWPEIDEDISLENILQGQASGESDQSLARWQDWYSRKIAARTNTARG